MPSLRAFSATVPFIASAKAELLKIYSGVIIVENIASVLSEYKKEPNRIQKKCILVVNVQEKLSELVGRRIRELGLKNADIARLSGLSRSYIGNIVNETAPTQSGQYNLSPKSVSALAKALQISEIEIVNAMGYVKSSSDDAEIVELETMYRKGRRLTSVRMDAFRRLIAMADREIDRLLEEEEAEAARK